MLSLVSDLEVLSLFEQSALPGLLHLLHLYEFIFLMLSLILDLEVVIAGALGVVSGVTA